MSFFHRFLGIEARSAQPMTFQSVWGMGGDIETGGTKAGKRVNKQTALQVSAVYGCVRILSDNIATLPMDSYRRVDGTRRPFRPKPAWMFFREGPWSKVDVLNQVMVSLLLDGNAYVLTHRDPKGNITYLEVLDPDRVTPEIIRSEIYFDVANTEGRSVRLTRTDVLHIRGMTLPGEIKGVSPITFNRETIGLSMAATEFGAAFFGNGALPGMAIEVPGALSDIGISALKRGWNDAHQGAGNAHKIAVLTEGAKFSKVTISPEDAQFLQTRQFQVVDIARIFGVPAHMLQHADVPQVGTSMAEQNIAFVQHALRPWVERIEAALTWALWSDGMPQEAFVKLNMDGLLRGDHGQRYETYAKAVVQGIITINEARAWEDLPPVPWGDEPISVQVADNGVPNGQPDDTEEST
jgi:HK97 family phage portal protein